MFKSIKKHFKLKKQKRKFLEGFEKFDDEQSTTEDLYVNFRSLFIHTKGKLNDELSEKINNKICKYSQIDNVGILGNNKSHFENAKKMKEDGFFIFDAILPQKSLDAIFEYAKNTPVSYLDLDAENEESKSKKVIFDELNIISPRYQFTGNEVFGCSELQQLIFDKSLLAFAQEYLGCKPILDLVAFWWSAPFFGKGKSAAAQMYHFDLDRVKFMKFFFYITDVDSETGPHCFVKGSHGKLPKEIDRDGRFEDIEIEKVYGKENLLELCGKKGSIMAVDTRGFHKGKDLIKGKRLLFQIQFTNSLFGQSYNKVDYKLINEKYVDTMNKYEYSYRNIC